MKSAYPILDPASREANQRQGKCALAMMIKAPRAGASKTRLVPPLTHAEAAAMSVCFLRDTAASIAEVCESLKGDGSAGAAEGVAVYTPVGSEEAFDGLLPRGFTLLAQRGDSFGERLFHAAEDLFQLGYESCCLIDSDSPTLPHASLTAAVEELRRAGDRIALGPAEDGGYYLLGLKRAHRRLFEEVAWSTAEVSAQTIERAREINLDAALLPAWYDVDDAGALRRLAAELLDVPHEDNVPREDNASGEEVEAGERQLRPNPAKHTRDYLRRLLEGEGRARILGEAGAGAAVKQAEGCS